MARLIDLKIDVTKIDKRKLYVGKKGTYLNITVALNDEPDQYGNDVSVWENQSEEERKVKAPKNYLGNGKTVWQSDAQTVPAANPTDKAKPAEINELPF